MVEKRGKESKIKGNSLGASGFTLGILGILSLGWVGLVISFIGFIFCFFQQKNKPTKLGKAGLIVSVVGFILCIVYIIYLAPILVKYMQQLTTSTA